jgi:Ca2+/Na+ antiporter
MNLNITQNEFLFNSIISMSLIFIFICISFGLYIWLKFKKHSTDSLIISGFFTFVIIFISYLKYGLSEQNQYILGVILVFILVLIVLIVIFMSDIQTLSFEEVSQRKKEKKRLHKAAFEKGYFDGLQRYPDSEMFNISKDMKQSFERKNVCPPIFTYSDFMNNKDRFTGDCSDYLYHLGIVIGYEEKVKTEEQKNK